MKSNIMLFWLSLVTLATLLTSTLSAGPIVNSRNQVVGDLYGDGSGFTNTAVKVALTNVAGSVLAYGSMVQGEYGWSFKTTNPITITAIGKWKYGQITGVLDVQLRRTNNLGNCEIISKAAINIGGFDSNQFCYVELPFPVTLETNVYYSVTYTYPSGSTNSGYQVASLVTPNEIVPGFGVSPTTDCQGYSGWSGQGFCDVNFRYRPAQILPNTFNVSGASATDGSSTSVKFDATVWSPASTKFHFNSAFNYNEKPYDNGRFMKTPFRRMAPFLDYYPAEDFTETLYTNLVIRWSTNGMAAAGWTHLVLDDGWQAASRSAAGTVTWNTTRFPSGIPWLANYLHTNGFKLGVFTCWTTNGFNNSIGSPWWPTVYNVCQLSNDLRNFMLWGVDSLFYDWSVGSAATSIEAIRTPARIFSDVVTAGDIQYNGTNLNRGMISAFGSNLGGPFFTNQALPFEYALAVNSLTLNGDENNVYAPAGGGGSYVGEPTFYTKVKGAYAFPWFTATPGHFVDAQAIHSAVPSNICRVLFNSFVMGPLGFSINPGATNVCMGLLTNATFWNTYYDDIYSPIPPKPGWSVGTNGWQVEIWRRPINVYGNTNLVCFINASNQTAILKFTNTMVGATGEVAFDDVWTGARFGTTTNGVMNVSLTTSNAATYVTYPISLASTLWSYDIPAAAWAGGSFTRMDVNTALPNLSLPEGMFEYSTANHTTEIPVPIWTTQAVCFIEVAVTQQSYWTNTLYNVLFVTNSSGDGVKIYGSPFEVYPPYYMTNQANARLSWTNNWPATNAAVGKSIRFQSGAKTNASGSWYYFGPLHITISPAQP